MTVTVHEITKASPKKHKVLYVNVLTFAYWILAAFYGLYLCFTSAKLATILFSYAVFICAQLGVSAGAHRLWSHRTYKAKLPLQIILMVFNSMAFQNSAITWIRDHRLHHKYSDTDADPHNPRRGLFFAHFGWLLVKKHEEVKRLGQTIDLSDVKSNKVLQFQYKYAVPVMGGLCFVLPTIIPMVFWGETFTNAWHLCMLRYMMNVNVALSINSIAHRYGNRPYDASILPGDSTNLSYFSFGEGFHNFHHVFPWDYRSAELGFNYLNLTTKFIDFFAWVGWAYDLKAVSPEMIRARANRTGEKAEVSKDNTEPENDTVKINNGNSWCWEDRDIDEDMKSLDSKSDFNKELTQRNIIPPQRA